jgi:nitrogen fixation protein FixH
MTALRAPKSAWRLFPLALILWLCVVAAVNIVMITDAIGSFPGLAAKNEFSISNNYDKILEVSARQSALGWQVTAGLDGMRPVIQVMDRASAPLTTAIVTASAQRPLGPPQTLELIAGETTLPAPGPWDLTIRVRQGEQTLAVTRRVVAK